MHSPQTHTARTATGPNDAGEDLTLGGLIAGSTMALALLTLPFLLAPAVGAAAAAVVPEALAPTVGFLTAVALTVLGVRVVAGLGEWGRTRAKA